MPPSPWWNFQQSANPNNPPAPVDHTQTQTSHTSMRNDTINRWAWVTTVCNQKDRSGAATALIEIKVWIFPICGSRYHLKLPAVCLITKRLAALSWYHHLNKQPKTKTETPVQVDPFFPPWLNWCLQVPNLLSALSAKKSCRRKEKVINLTLRCEYSSHCLPGFDSPHLELL